MSRIYLDSMVLIYWLENNPEFGGQLERIFSVMLRRRDRLCASALSLGEVLAKPLQTGEAPAAELVRRWFASSEVTLLPFSLAAGELFAELRARHRVKPADAIHLAIAAAGGVDLFLTNDHRLHGVHVPGIDFIAPLDTPLF